MAPATFAEQTPLARYIFDFHSHFSAILPTQRTHPDDTGPSLARLLAQRFYADDAQAAAKGELLLFDYALSLMIDPASNPFARLLRKANRAEYEAAECVAENLYIACQAMAADAGYSAQALALPPQSPALYALVGREIVAPALASAPDARLRALVRYFNDALYSASRHVPSDDAGVLRRHFVQRLCGGDPASDGSWSEVQKASYRQWAMATFDALREDGVLLAQSVVPEEQIRPLAELAQHYNARYGTDYRLLVHAPQRGLPAGALTTYLADKVEPLLAGQGEGYASIVGLSMSGTQNKASDYAELLAWLQAKAPALRGNFGGDGARARRAIVRIDCAEGSGVGAENRSLIGGCIHQAGEPDPAFHVALSARVRDAWSAAQASQEGASPAIATPRGLFEAVFAHTAFAHAGLELRRFDVDAPLSRARAGARAKRNAMALVEALDQPSATPATDRYHALARDNPLYAFRIGHDHHHRGYLVSSYPWLAFDTTLGGDAIAGASALLQPAQDDRLDRGDHRPRSDVESDVLAVVGDAVLGVKAQGLSQAKVAKFVELAWADGLAATLQHHRAFLQQQLTDALAPIHDPAQDDVLFDLYCQLVLYCAGDKPAAALRYQALVRAFLPFQNWRSCLLGSDGQGVSRTTAQHGYLRMQALLIHTLRPDDHGALQEDVLNAVAAVLRKLALGYWKATIGQPGALQNDADPPRHAAPQDGNGPASGGEGVQHAASQAATSDRTGTAMDGIDDDRRQAPSTPRTTATDLSQADAAAQEPALPEPAPERPAQYNFDEMKRSLGNREHLDALIKLLRPH